MKIIDKIPENYWEEYRNFRLNALNNEETVFGASYDLMSKKPDIYWKDQINSSNNNGKMKVLLAISRNSILGMIIVKLSKFKKLKHVARISSFYVIPECRGKGIGKKLFYRVLKKISQNREIKKIKLVVNTKQKNAINLYKIFGFKEVGRLSKEFKIENVFYDVYIMEKLL